MAIQVRRGNEVDFDPSKMLPGEWAVSLDTRYVRMCFSSGIVLRMATYEAFEADMAEIQSIVAEARTIQEAVARIQSEINDTAIVVEDYAILSKSYAVGTNNEVREGDATDNAKYYYEQAKHISQGGNGLVPLGTIAFENLPTEDILTNAMYNISNDFTSDERFLDGGGILYGKGSNVFYTADGKWDVLAASDVKGVKGEAEDTFRQGNVNITKGNIGLENVDNTSDADKPISNEQQAEFDRIDDLLGDTDISSIADGTLTGAVSEVNENLLKNAKDYTGLNFDEADFGVFVSPATPDSVGATNHPINKTGMLVHYKTDMTSYQEYHTYDGEIYTRSRYRTNAWSAWDSYVLNSHLENITQNTKDVLLVTSTTQSDSIADFAIPNYSEYNALFIEMYGDANVGGMSLYIPKAMYNEAVPFSCDTTPYGSAYTLFVTGRVSSGHIFIRKSIVTGWSVFSIRVFGLK